MEKSLQKMSYREYLRSDAWGRVRLAALTRDDFRCRICNKNIRDGGGEVHHRMNDKHLRGHEIDEVVTLCSFCHEVVHVFIKRHMRLRTIQDKQRAEAKFCTPSDL